MRTVLFVFLCVVAFYIEYSVSFQFGIFLRLRNGRLSRLYENTASEDIMADLDHPVLSREDEIRLFREYDLGRVVLNTTGEISIKKGAHATDEEVAAELHTTPEIIARARRNGIAANITLNRCNERLVYWVAEKHQNRGLTMRSLMEAGRIGLNQGISRYKDVSNKLSSFVVWYIKGAIQDAIVRNLGLTHNEYRTLTKFRKARQKHGMNIYAIGEELKMKMATVRKYEKLHESISRRLAPQLNLEMDLKPDDPKSMYTLGDHLANKKAKNQFVEDDEISDFGDPYEDEDEYEDTEEEEDGDDDDDDNEELEEIKESSLIKLKPYLQANEYKVLSHRLDDISVELTAKLLVMTVDEVQKYEHSAREKLKLPGLRKLANKLNSENNLKKNKTNDEDDDMYDNEEDEGTEEPIGFSDLCNRGISSENYEIEDEITIEL